MKIFFLAFFLLFVVPASAIGHFGALIVNPPMLEQPQQKELTIQLAFCHPRAAEGMDMAKPDVFAVWHNNMTTDLLPALQEQSLFNAQAWAALFQATIPGDHIFYMSPQPYWEEAEQCFIVHHTKTVVNAYDMQDGWHHAIGLPMEIIPLTRPYGLYAGNSFSAQVLQHGEPLANCKVEVEFFDPTRQRGAANEALATQTLLTDTNGYFTWSFPWPGWWGMCALAGPSEITHNGKTVELETGGVLWLYISEIPGK